MQQQQDPASTSASACHSSPHQQHATSNTITMSSLRRQPRSPQGGTAIEVLSGIGSNTIMLLVQTLFVVLLCGSSYLAGCMWGQYSLGDNDGTMAMAGAGMMSGGSAVMGGGVTGGAGSSASDVVGVGRLMSGRSGGGAGDGTDCSKIFDQVVEAQVQKGTRKTPTCSRQYK